MVAIVLLQRNRVVTPANVYIEHCDAFLSPAEERTGEVAMENELIEWLRSRIPARADLPLGLSDDAALIDLRESNQLVATTDLLTDQIDFLLEQSDRKLVGRKSLAVNLSDLAAMAARPVAALVSLALPRDGALELAKELYEGMFPLLDDFQIGIAGGDTNTWNGPLVISVTVIGKVEPPGLLRRSAAIEGDVVLVTGDFGGSIFAKQFEFQPRVHEAITLNSNFEIHAATDVSDGLAIDTAHVARESGCGIVLDLKAIPVAPAAFRLADERNCGSTPLDHALSDGEDFELIFTAPPNEADRILAEQPLGIPVTRIGHCIGETGLWMETHGERCPLEATGYQH